jgi:hypothetical protein
MIISNYTKKLLPMKAKIILLALMSFFLVTQEIQAQKVKKEKKNRKERRQTEIQKETNENSIINETTTTKIPLDTGTDGKGQTQSREVKPLEIVNLEELIDVAEPVITTSPMGSVNWTDQFVEAKGVAVIDYDRFPNPAQARAMATRGATVVAQRNLLEIIQGVNVVSETTVKDMMVQNDYIYTRVDGVIKGAVQVGEAVEKDGMMEVTMRVPMYGKHSLATAVYDAIPENPMAGERRMLADVLTEDGEIPSGLVFNFNGKQYDPSMFPVVVDQNGKMLLDLTQFYDPNEGKFPKILSGTREIFDEIKFKEGTQIIDVIQSFDGKIVVDPDSAPGINWDKIQKGVSTATKIFKFLLALI